MGCGSSKMPPRPTARSTAAGLVASFGGYRLLQLLPSKNLGCYGDGGHVDERYPVRSMERVRRLRHHGRVGKYEHAELGWGDWLDALQAAILRAKLPHLDGVDRRAAGSCAALRRVVCRSQVGRLRWIATIIAMRTILMLSVGRAGMRWSHIFRRAGIGVVIHYVPMHLAAGLSGDGSGPRRVSRGRGRSGAGPVAADLRGDHPRDRVGSQHRGWR